MSVVYYEVGRMLAGHIRTFLEAERFLGRKIEWLESKGFFTRQFTIKGDSQDIRMIVAQIDHWAVSNNLT